MKRAKIKTLFVLMVICGVIFGVIYSSENEIPNAKKWERQATISGSKDGKGRKKQGCGKKGIKTLKSLWNSSFYAISFKPLREFSNHKKIDVFSILFRLCHIISPQPFYMCYS